MFETPKNTADKAHADALQNDPDIQAAQRGQYGKWAAFAASLPAAWPPAIRNMVVSQSIASEKGLDTSGLDASNNFKPTDNGVPIGIQVAPYAIGATGGFAGAFAGAGTGGGSSLGGIVPGLIDTAAPSVASAVIPGIVPGVASTLANNTDSTSNPKTPDQSPLQTAVDNKPAPGGAPANPQGPMANGLMNPTTTTSVPSSLAPAAKGSMDYLGLGKTIYDGIGGYLSSKGASDTAEANRQETAGQTAARLIDSQSQQDRTNAANALQPLGEDQKFTAQNALRQSILGNMKPTNYARGDQSFQGIVPNGGFDPTMLEANYGQTATLNALTDRHKQLAAINPQAPASNLGNYGGFGDAATPFTDSVSAYQGQVAGKQDAQRSQVQDYINAGLSGNLGSLKKAVVGTGNPGYGYHDPNAAGRG